MRDSKDMITSRIRREELVGLLDSMTELDRQRVTAEMQVVEVPPEAVGEQEPAQPASYAKTVRRADTVSERARRNSYPEQVDAAIDAIVDHDAIKIAADSPDDRITQPVTYSISEPALDDFVVRFATGTGKAARLSRPDVTGPLITIEPSSDLRRRMPRWAIVAASCFVTLVLAALLIAAA